MRAASFSKEAAVKKEYLKPRDLQNCNPGVDSIFNQGFYPTPVIYLTRVYYRKLFLYENQVFTLFQHLRNNRILIREIVFHIAGVRTIIGSKLYV